MTFWATDPTSTDPASYTTTSDSDETLTFDTTALLVAGGAPSAPLATLYRIVDDGADVAVTMADVPIVGASNTITQRLRGLTADTTYKLRLSFLTSSNRRAMTLVVIVVE